MSITIRNDRIDTAIEGINVIMNQTTVTGQNYFEYSRARKALNYLQDARDSALSALREKYAVNFADGTGDIAGFQTERNTLNALTHTITEIGTPIASSALPNVGAAKKTAMVNIGLITA